LFLIVNIYNIIKEAVCQLLFIQSNRVYGLKTVGKCLTEGKKTVLFGDKKNQKRRGVPIRPGPLSAQGAKISISLH
jgi:hypothetical protein